MSNHLKPVHIHEFDHLDIELIWVEISCNHGTILLGCLYRPPNLGSQFFDEYQSVLESILPFSHRYSGIAILGDFNIDPVFTNICVQPWCTCILQYFYQL